MWSIFCVEGCNNKIIRTISQQICWQKVVNLKTKSARLWTTMETLFLVTCIEFRMMIWDDFLNKRK